MTLLGLAATEVLGLIVAVLTVVVLMCTCAGLATRFVLLPWLRDNLVSPVEETREQLDFNGGGSLKDDVHGIAVAVGLLQRKVDDMGVQFTDHISQTAETKGRHSG